MNWLTGIILTTIFHTAINKPQTMETTTQLATFGGGCFWCTEAFFEEVNGVITVTSGYSGGGLPNPTYQQVCQGNTGHAEVVQIEFNPEVITFARLLELFFMTHNPTTLNQQGADVGSQYRSVVFFHTPQQKEQTLNYIQELTNKKTWPDKIVTQVVPLTNFYKAEDYHQNYFEQHPEQGYCQIVIAPKLQKFRKSYYQYLKK